MSAGERVFMACVITVIAIGVLVGAVDSAKNVGRREVTDHCRSYGKYVRDNVTMTCAVQP